MTTIKIECGCGQHYSFEVEPVGGQMPFTVACPACNTDGTEAANAVIAASQTAPAITASIEQEYYPPPAGSPMPQRPPSPAPAASSRRPSPQTRPINTEQAMHEARAKILWGDPPREVARYLMMQGFAAAEATELVNELFQERAATIRGDGIKKIFMGIGLILVPIIAWFSFMSFGRLFVKLFALTIMAGLYGVYVLIKGIFMTMAPKSVAGDASEQ